MCTFEVTCWMFFTIIFAGCVVSTLDIGYNCKLCALVALIPQKWNWLKSLYFANPTIRPIQKNFFFSQSLHKLVKSCSKDPWACVQNFKTFYKGVQLNQGGTNCVLFVPFSSISWTVSSIELIYSLKSSWNMISY